MGDAIVTPEVVKLSHEFSCGLRHGVTFSYTQNTYAHHAPSDSAEKSPIGHIGACVEQGQLIIGEGADVIYVKEDYRGNGIASQMFTTFICNVWDAVPYNLRSRIQVIMRNGEAGNDKLLQWLISLGVDRSRVLDYTRPSNDRTVASKTDAESETYLQMQLSYLYELFS